MVSDQAVKIESDVVLPNTFCECFQETAPVPITEENHYLIVPTKHHVIDRTRVDHSAPPWHAWVVIQKLERVQPNFTNN